MYDVTIYEQYSNFQHPSTAIYFLQNVHKKNPLTMCSKEDYTHKHFCFHNDTAIFGIFESFLIAGVYMGKGYLNDFLRQLSDNLRKFIRSVLDTFSFLHPMVNRTSQVFFMIIQNLFIIIVYSHFCFLNMIFTIQANLVKSANLKTK